MALINTHGFILKRRNYGEADRIITIFTKKMGKVTAIGKGVRKPLSKLGGHLELFNQTELALAEGKTWFVVAQATTISTYTNIRCDLRKTSIAYLVAELVDSLTHENESQPKVYSLLSDTFDLLNSNVTPLLASVFVWHLLSCLGYQPELYYCVGCRKRLTPDNLYFSFHLGGLLCKEHKNSDKNSIEIELDTIKLLRLTLSHVGMINKVAFNKKVSDQFELIVSQFSHQVIDRQPKSETFLKEMHSVVWDR